MYLVLHLSVYILSPQQAFNATAVIRHMRRLQLGTSFGSSNHNANNPQSRAPAKSQSVDCAPLSLKDCEWHFRRLCRHKHVQLLVSCSAELCSLRCPLHWDGWRLFKKLSRCNFQLNRLNWFDTSHVVTTFLLPFNFTYDQLQCHISNKQLLVPAFHILGSFVFLYFISLYI